MARPADAFGEQLGIELGQRRALFAYPPGEELR
jgi:hypothetical protein